MLHICDIWQVSLELEDTYKSRDQFRTNHHTLDHVLTFFTRLLQGNENIYHE